MTETTFRIPITSDRSVTAIQNVPVKYAGNWLFVYAPGSGSSINDPFGAYLARELAENGITCVRFQFLYTEAGRSRPDSQRVAESTWQAIIDSVRPGDGRLAIGGRSYGGRIASQVVSRGTEVDALALFAYPLRPPYDKSQIRDEHFDKIKVPTLFCSGTRDAFASLDELRNAASKASNALVHELEGADHGFNTLKSSGRTKQEVWGEASNVLLKWLP